MYKYRQITPKDKKFKVVFQTTKLKSTKINLLITERLVYFQNASSHTDKNV